MSGPGYVFKNSGLTPPVDDEISDKRFDTRIDEDTTKSTANESSPTYQGSAAQLDPTPIFHEKVAHLQKVFTPDSHQLAKEDHRVQGAVQIHQNEVPFENVRDIGWHKPNHEIPDPLIGGLTNGQLFSMIRRFNKDVFAVTRVPEHIARGLDLNEAWAEEYATDKLTLHLQRVYLTIVLGLASLGKHISRIRSWHETGRTSAFFLAYSVAWALNFLVPLFLGTLIVIVASKDVRDILFPPAPRALVSLSTGGIQKPQAGQLGTSDSLTGAPEKQEGEAIEEEAKNFVNNIRHLVQKAIGMHEKEKNQGDPLEGKVPKPIKKVIKGIKGGGTTDGHAEEDPDQTQKPMEEILWSKANPEIISNVLKTAPHVVGEIVDNWERFANAISPTPPFSRLSFLRIEGVLLPLFVGSFFVTGFMVYKGIGFAIGLSIFGDPILTPAMAFLQEKIPNWVELLEPKNNIFRGVPTNSQLTLTLLRIGEAYNTPIPPVPTSKKDDADMHQSIDIDEIPLKVSDGEKMDALEPSSTQKAHSDENSEEEKANEPKHKHLSKFTRIFKGQTKAAVETKLAADKVLAAAGSKKAKSHAGVLPKAEKLVYAGPSDFAARHDGKKGWLYITEGSDPSLSFTTHDSQSNESRTGLDPVVTIPVDEIKTLKRATAFHSKSGEMAANWSSDRELLGSLEIEEVGGRSWRFTAIPERDELFNRLVALGGQKWENL